MDANKKIDFEQVQCPPESKLLTNIIKNHPLRFIIAASSSVPWIYMEQFWLTLKEDGSKYRLMYMLDKKEISLTMDDFRTIFHLPQATNNNHDSFMPPPSFVDMVPFYKNELGFTMELKTSSSFKTTGLLQPWQTLCKIFSKYLTTRVTGWDQPPLQIMQMMYCFINNIHVDYAELLCEGLHYSLHHPTSSIPYPRFTKIIISHYMTNFLEISRCARDRYHNLKDDDIMKNIFNSGRYKDKVGMKIPAWMISKEMKHTEHYRMYAEVFGIDVHLTQSQLTESTQGMHRTPSVPRRSTRLTPLAPMPTVDKADEMILQDTLQNVIDDSSIPRNDDQNIPGTRLEPKSDTESPKVEITNDEEVEITNVVIPMNVNEEEEEITDGVYELKRREKRKIVEESRSTPFPTPIRSPRIHTDLVYLDTEKLQELTVTDTTLTPSSSSLNTKLSTTNRLLSLFKAKPARFKRYKSFFQELQGRYGYLFEHLRAKFLSRKSFDTLADHLQEVMVESLPTMVDKHIKEQVKMQVPEQVKVQVPVYVAKGLLLERKQNKEETDKMIAKAMLQERGKLQAEISLHIQKAIDTNIPSLVDASVRSYMSGHILHVHPAQPQTTSVPLTTCKTSAVRPRDQDDPHDDAHPEGENSAKRQKTSEYETHVIRESSGQVNEKEQGQSSSRNQEQIDDYDFWTESYASDDDDVPTKQVPHDIMEEVSLTINEAELKKITDEMLRQRCTSGDEHQYHIDQMKNFLKSDIFKAFREHPEAPALSLINQDLLYLEKGNSGPEKIVLSLHKFLVIIFNDVDIEERTSRWVNKQKEPGKPKEVFITEIVARKSNECIVSITEPDYKNLNKNDIEDMYLLIMNGKVPDYAETGQLWSLSVFIRTSVIWERVYDFQLDKQDLTKLTQLMLVPPNSLQNKYKTQFKMNSELCGQNNHLFENYYEVLFCKKCKRTNHRTCDHADFMYSMDINQYHIGQSESSLRSRPSRPAMPFPSCIYYGYTDHQSDDCVYYPICEIYGSYDHDTHGHNMIISLKRGIKPRKPQHITKNCETCSRNVYTTSNHNDIEWFRKSEALQAKKAESFKASKTESSNALRSKTPIKRSKKSKSGISINKEKDVNDLLRMNDKIGSSVNTPIMPPNMLGPDLNGKAVNESQYRGMIGPLMNLTASRPNIQFSTALCKTSSKHKESHLISVKKFQVSFSIPTGGIYGVLGVNTFRKAIGTHYLSHSSDYVDPPSIDIVRPWFSTIGYREEVSAKGTLKKSLLPPREAVAFKDPKPSSNVERVPLSTKPGAKPRHKKHSTSSKQPSMYSKEATKGGSSKAPIISKTGHSKKRKESSSAMDSNLSQPLVSTHVDTGMHKEDQQETGCPTSLGVTSKERANPQLSSGMSSFNLNKPIYLTSFISHSESASGNDVLAVSIAEADPENSAPSDFVPQQQGINEGTKNTSYDHLFVGACSVARQIEEETSSLIKLEDLAKLVSHVKPSFKDLDSPEDDHVIIVDDTDEDKEDEIHAATNDETEDTFHKLEFEKNKAEAEVFLLKAQPSFPNVEPLNELLEKSLKTKFSNILYAHNFSSSLPTELKDLPSKFNKLAEEWELLEEFLSLPVQVAFVQAKLKTLDALLGLLLNVTQALNKFAQVLNSASSKARDHSVPSAGQADTRPAEGDKDTNQATNSQLFQRQAEKNAEKENLNNQQPKPTPPPPISPIITTTTHMQSSFLSEEYK
ncbi:hypothetical protein Tco_0489715 [Tanacetum coccineum]